MAWRVHGAAPTCSKSVTEWDGQAKLAPTYLKEMAEIQEETPENMWMDIAKPFQKEIVDEMEQYAHHWEQVIKLEHYACRGEWSPCDNQANLGDLVEQGSCIPSAQCLMGSEGNWTLRWTMTLPIGGSTPHTGHLLTESQHVMLSEENGPFREDTVALITERSESVAGNKERTVVLEILPISAENLLEGKYRIDLIPSWIQENRQKAVIREFITIKGSLGPSFVQLAIATKIISHKERLTANRDQTPWPLIEQHFHNIAIRAELNDSQRKAAFLGLSSKLTCTQGPPGTGKTTLASALLRIANLSTQGPLPTFACAPSHAAVDNLTIRLRQDGAFNICRYADPKNRHPSAHDLHRSKKPIFAPSLTLSANRNASRRQFFGLPTHSKSGADSTLRWSQCIRFLHLYGMS